MIVVTGQTATGKTELALKLAKEYDGELVNFDSRQVYKYLDVITGKDLPASKVHLYDVVSPNQFFSSHDWVVAANKVIDDIERRGKTPVLVGGTYLYLKHLLYGFDVSAPPDFELRKRLEEKTVKELQLKLEKLDPRAFETLNYSDRNNPRRLVRKIEVATHSGLPAGKRKKMIKPKVFIGLRFKDNENLRRVIERRVKMRLKQGAVEEVRSILKRGYKETDPGLKTIGYVELIKYLKGDFSKEKAIAEWVNHEVQYAGRQYTFMKKDKNITWREI